ncbi:tetratricopeptide repeat protein, partial [Lichenifustis flavocetrariae]
LTQVSAPTDAELAFRRAVDLQPDLAHAHFALGLLLMGHQREVDAASYFRRTLELMPDNADAAVCLGQACYVTGDYAGALAAFERAASLGAMPDGARRNLNRARAFCAMLEGRIEEALDRGARAGEDPEALLYEAFSLFSAHGHIDAAIRIGRLRLSRKPDDPVRAYLLEVLSGQSHLAAPVEYLESYFDDFAPTFEDKLVNVLGYQVPERLAALAAPHLRGRAKAIDLGCGTGLAAPWLKPLVTCLIGVDVASGMLGQARRGGCYDDLIKAEGVLHLAGQPSSCELIFAADMLVYLGPLEVLFVAAWNALRPDGLFCFSIETSTDQGHTLLPSGRFAHAPDYVRSLARSRFEVLEDQAHVIRLELRSPVNGQLFVMRRSPQ